MVEDLKLVSQKNIDTIKKSINKLYSGGGTNIPNGMQLAMKLLKNRKAVNDVTSIFLLSDGQDGGGGAPQVQKLMAAVNYDKPYTIHTFGFGSDHDPILMNQISKLKDGNFYYVQKLESVDEMFVDALGALFSVVAQNIDIKVSINKDNKKFSDVQISKVYGDIWQTVNQNTDYSVKIVQLISDTKKEFFLELAVPPINLHIEDNERNNVFLKAEVTAYSVTN